MIRTDCNGVATDALEKSARIGAARDGFLKDGYAILDHVVPPDTMRALAGEFDESYARYMHDREADDSLTVGPRRYMVPVGLSGGFGNPLIFANPYVVALVRQLLDKDAILEAFGAVVSLSGAQKQHIHRDSQPLFSAELSSILPPHALTLALPLIEMDETHGTTALWPGSHRWIKRNEDVPPEIPIIPVGSCLLWDFRLFHGGTANRSDRHRPMLYATYARRWFQDPGNFKKETQPRLVFEPDFLPSLPTIRAFSLPMCAGPHGLPMSVDGVGDVAGPGPAPMAKLIILDDVFDDATNQAIAGFDYGVGEKWYEMGSQPAHEKILAICADHFDLAEIAGYEMWSNTSKPGWHVDKDEKLFKDRKRLVFPLCSAVYYARVENMNGGEFYTEDVRFFPKTNRLVVFSPGIYHGVSAHVGTRIAISLNPWKRRLQT